jgi:hypothetical protein
MTNLSNQYNGLFRENALKKLNSLDDMNDTFEVIGPGAWLWLCIALCFIISIGVWGVWGTVSSNVIATGILIPSKQFEQAEKLVHDEISQRKAKLKQLKELLDKKKQLFEKRYLTFNDIVQTEHDYSLAKDDLVNFSNKGYVNTAMSIFSPQEDTNLGDLEALVFVHHQEGKRIHAGMAALLMPTNLSAYQYGYIKGTVITISNYPASKEAVYAYLGNMNLVDEFFSHGVPFLIRIKLEKNSITQSGLKWTTKNGAPFKIESGTSVVAKVINNTCSPLSLLIHKENNNA